MTNVEAVVALLHECGFRPSWDSAADPGRYYGERYTWLMFDADAEAFEVADPGSWPGLAEMIAFKNLKAFAQGQIKIEDLHAYLLDKRLQLTDQGLPADMVFNALTLYHEQYIVFLDSKLDFATALYTFEDCIRFATMSNDVRSMRKLVRLQLPHEVFEQMTEGIAPGLLLDLYASTAVGGRS